MQIHAATYTKCPLIVVGGTAGCGRMKERFGGGPSIGCIVLNRSLVGQRHLKVKSSQGETVMDS